MSKLTAAANPCFGLGNIRIECASSPPRFAGEFNGEPIGVPLTLLHSHRDGPVRTLFQFHQQLHIALSRKH
jgi:hypothetical protein